MEDIRSTEDYNKRYEEQLKQMSHAGNQNETTLKALMQMHETLVSELRKRQEDELQSLRALLQDARRQHEDELSHVRRKYEDELNDAQQKSEEEMSSVRNRVLEDMERVRRAKDEDLERLEKQRLEDARNSAAAQEAEMEELRAQWEEQMQELRRQHNEQVKGAALKDQLVGELEQTRAMLQEKEDLLAHLQTRFEGERLVLTQECMRMEEELSQLKHNVKDKDWNTARQQEELVMLRGTVRRKEEDEERYLQQVQQLRDVISGKEEAHQSLVEQNIALVNEARAKDDKIALLHSSLNETKDVRTLVQEHDAIVERFRAQVLALQTENSRCKFAGEQMTAEVDKVRDELRLQVMNLQQMANVVDAETKSFEKALADQQEQFRDLEHRFEDYQRQIEKDQSNKLEDSERYKSAVESQRLETEQIRSELFQIEQLSREQAAQTEQTRAELEECRAQLEQARAAAQCAENLEWDVAKQQEELVVLRGAIRRKDEEKLRLELEISSLKEAVTDLEEQLRGRQEGLDSLADESQKAMAEQVQLALHAQAQAAAAESEVARLKKEQDEKIKLLLETREDRGAELVNKTYEIERLQAQIRDMSQQVEHSMNELDRTRTDLGNELDRTRTDLGQREDDHQYVLEAMVAKDEELSLKEQQIKNVEARVEEVSALLARAEEQLQSSQHQESELREQIAALEGAVAEKQSEADSVLWESKGQQEEISRLRALVRRGNDEKDLLKKDLESQINELQASLGNAHRELSAIAERARHHEEQHHEMRHEEKNPMIQEIKARHEEELAHFRQLQADGLEELNRLNETRIHEMKEEHTAKLSDMRAKLDYEVENKTLALKLQLAERTADLDAAKKQLNSVEETMRSAQQALEEKISRLESSAQALEEDVKNKNAVITGLQIDLDALQKTIEDKQQEVAGLEAAHEREKKEREQEREKADSIIGDSNEKEVILKKYTDLVEELRGELETARSEVLRIEEDRMKAQEDNVIIRGSLRRKEEERQKLESENVKLLEVIGRKDLELDNRDALKQRMLNEHKADADAKQEILERLKGEQDALGKQALADKEAHEAETKDLLRKHDLEKRELLREGEQRNVELAQKAKDNSDLLVQIENLKDEVRKMQKSVEDQERNLDLKDQELIDFKGKHVAIVEALQIDLRRNQQELDRLELLVAELDEYKDQVGSLREGELNRVKELKQWEGTHQENLQLVASLRTELSAAQEKVAALEKQVQDLSKDLERDRAELVLLRGENRRKGDEIRKIEESHGSLQDTSLERSAAHQDEMEGLWRAINRKDEERDELKRELDKAGPIIEELKNQVQKLTADAEKKQKAMKELQSMVRGKSQLEKQDLLHSSVKQRKVEEQNQQLIQQLMQEQSRRKVLQLGWASLENTLKLSFPPLADARCHLVFTARSSLLKNDMREWMRNNFVKALNVDVSCVSVSHISWGSSWVGAVRSIDDQIQSWAPQVPEDQNLAMALLRFHTVKGSLESGMQLAERFCALMKKRGSALYQQLEPSRTTLLGCLPPHKTVEGEECMLPSEVATRMVVAEDIGLSLFLDHTGEYVVSYVLPESLAAEYEKIQPGDVVREIEGVSVHRKPVSEVSKLLMANKPDNTVAMLVCRTQDGTVDSNLVIMVRPKLAPSSSPSLAKARQSMLHPDITDLLATGDLSVSMAVHPSFEGMPQHLDFDESIILDPRGGDKLEGTPATGGGKELVNKTPGYRRLPDLHQSPHQQNAQLNPKTRKEEAEEIARLQVLLTEKKLHLENLTRSATSRSPPKSRSRSPQKSRASPPNVRYQASPPQSQERSLASPQRSSVASPSARDGLLDQAGERGVPLQWETLDI